MQHQQKIQTDEDADILTCILNNNLIAFQKLWKKIDKTWPVISYCLVFVVRLPATNGRGHFVEHIIGHQMCWPLLIDILRYAFTVSSELLPLFERIWHIKQTAKLQEWVMVDEDFSSLQLALQFFYYLEFDKLWELIEEECLVGLKWFLNANDMFNDPSRTKVGNFEFHPTADRLLEETHNFNHFVALMPNHQHVLDVLALKQFTQDQKAVIECAICLQPIFGLETHQCKASNEVVTESTMSGTVYYRSLNELVDEKSQYKSIGRRNLSKRKQIEQSKNKPLQAESNEQDVHIPKFQDVVTFLCKHTFHHDCILSWLENRKTTCPLCRKSIYN